MTEAERSREALLDVLSVDPELYSAADEMIGFLRAEGRPAMRELAAMEHGVVDDFDSDRAVLALEVLRFDLERGEESDASYASIAA